MDREGCWRPAGTGGMTGLTGGWYAKRNVVGVYRLVVTGLLSTYADIGGVVVVSSRVTTVAIGRSMGSR